MKTIVTVSSKYLRLQLIQGQKVSWYNAVLFCLIALSPHFSFEIEMKTEWKHQNETVSGTFVPFENLPWIFQDVEFDSVMDNGNTTYTWYAGEGWENDVELDDDVWGEV